MWNNGWHEGQSGWWLLFMLLMMIVFWGGLAWLIVTLVRRGDDSGSRTLDGHQTRSPSAEDVLRERLARGEIDVDEYHARLEALRSTKAP